MTVTRPRAESRTVYLGIEAGRRAIHICSNLGHQSSISADAIGAAEDWVELATYGLQLPEHDQLLACVALPSGLDQREGAAILRAARAAGWDGVLLVNVAHAAGRGLSGRDAPEGDALAVVVLDRQVSTVGLLAGAPLMLEGSDHVNPIPGREARELAVSLRCLIKQRPRDLARRLLRRVVVAGDGDELARIGARKLAVELEGVGVSTVDFELEPFLPARGATRIAYQTAAQTWRRARRRWT